MAQAVPKGKVQQVLQLTKAVFQNSSRMSSGTDSGFLADMEKLKQLVS